MIRLQLNLLGGFDCRSSDGQPIEVPARARAMLACLAVNAPVPHERDRMAALLWGEHTQAQARANLRKTISRLRAALPEAGRACLEIHKTTLALLPDRVELDLRQFERLAAAGTPESLERAAGLYRGELLAGFGTCDRGFDDWLMQERRRLEETFQEVLRRLLDHYVVTGAVDRAIQTALRVLTLDPLQEAVHRTLMRLYMYQDRIGAAFDQYRRCRELLGTELGVAPEPETERLHDLLIGGNSTPEPNRERDELPERAAVVRAAGRQRERRRTELVGLPSLAVLPFRADAGTGLHLGDGLAEDIATELSRFRELAVIAPASAQACRGAEAARAGAELGVVYVLSGSLRRLDEGLRITAHLTETGSGRQLWAERYDVARPRLFGFQDQVVGRIVGSLVGRIEDARLAATRRQPPADGGAYDLWLRGWHALRHPDLAAIGAARRLFQQALAEDPGFARAYVGLAMANLSEWACYSWNHWFFPGDETLTLARTAVELDRHDHRAHCILGVAQLYGGDDEVARRELLTALELNPHDADVLAHVAAAMALLGEHDLAVESGRAALRLAPYHPDWYAAFAGIALFAARHYEEAIATMAPAPEALCNTPAFIAAAYARLGQPEKAAGHRDTVHRHHARQVARGMFPKDIGCIDWLLALDPFRRPADAEHYALSLREAGFQ